MSAILQSFAYSGSISQTCCSFIGESAPASSNLDKVGASSPILTYRVSKLFTVICLSSQTFESSSNSKTCIISEIFAASLKGCKI